METFKIKSHAGSDKLLKLEIPVELSDVDYDITVLLQPRMTREEWLAFIEETAGSLADDPIEREPQGEYEVRDELL